MIEITLNLKSRESDKLKSAVEFNCDSVPYEPVTDEEIAFALFLKHLLKQGTELYIHHFQSQGVILEGGGENAAEVIRKHYGVKG